VVISRLFRAPCATTRVGSHTKYFPAIATQDDLVFPPLSAYETAFDTVHSTPVLIPSDCVDGFLDAYWARPEAYLDATIRAGMSGFRISMRASVRGGFVAYETTCKPVHGTHDIPCSDMRPKWILDCAS